MISANRVENTFPISHERITWLLIAGLLILRFPILIWAAHHREIVSWAIPLAEIGTYGFVALLVWWERQRLAESHIDGIALGLLFVKPLEVLFYLDGFDTHQVWPYILYLPISLTLAIGLFFHRPTSLRVFSRHWAWVYMGILVGAVMGIGIGYVFAHYQVQNFHLEWRKSVTDILADSTVLREYLGFLLVRPAQQLFYAGGMEEPLFRGFLWGALRRAGLKDARICLLQACLFCLGHIYYLTTGLYWSLGFAFFAALILGVLAWRSHSIATSMLAHGFTNAWSDFFGSVLLW